MEPCRNTTLEPDLQGFLRNRSESVLLEVTAPWSGHGHLLSPIVRRALDHFDGLLSHFTVDADRRPDIAQAFGVHKLPTLLFIKHGELAGSLTGTVPEKELIARISEFFEINPNRQTKTSGGHHE
jgi:thioredoxin-like negative regulator of GroEL